MLSYVNLILIIVLTISLIVGFYLVKKKYEEDIDMQDERLIKLLGQLNKNDKYLKDVDIKNKEEVQALITKNSNDLGENRGLIADNIGLVDAVVDRLDTTTNNEDVVEGFQSLTVDEIKAKQSATLQKIAKMILPSGIEKKEDDASTLLPQENPLVPPEQPDDDVVATPLDTTTPSPSASTPLPDDTLNGSAQQQTDTPKCSGEVWRNKPELYFNADCSNAINVGDTCVVTPLQGYEGGSVLCTVDGYLPTASTAITPPADAVAPPPADAVAPPPPPPADAAVPPADAVVPPADAVVPPADAAVPPADAAVPPADAVVPPADAAVPPADAAVPPADAAVPPADAAVPPADAAVPPADAVVPPADSSLSSNIISGFTLLSNNKKCTDNPSYMAGYADGTGGFMNNNISTKEDCSVLCNSKNDCKHFSYRTDNEQCHLYNENCNLDSDSRWKTFKKNNSPEAFKQFMPFMHTQKGVTTSTEAFFQPLITKC
jgi:hypothetical protein